MYEIPNHGTCKNRTA
ncbi:hypothetical protein [Pararhizobium sp. IMCC21322]